MTNYITRILLLSFCLAVFSMAPSYALTLSEAQKLLASDGAEDDQFGGSVSISGDTAVIGVPGDDDNGSSSGSAYVFIRDGTVWREQQKLNASDGEGGDRFGWSVSISGDTVVIGAFRDDDNGNDSGSAYVFVHDGAGIWREQQKLNASDGMSDDWFGYSVSIYADTAVIGAFRDDDNGSESGSATVFVRDGAGVWREQQKLNASDGKADNHFGYAVSISGSTTVIGSFRDDDNGLASGSATVFARDGTLWSEQQKLIASDGAADDFFGVSVSISGDTALIGTESGDNNCSRCGSAYMFLRDGTVWREQQKLTASDAAAGDFFGITVSLSVDMAVIGASRDDDNGAESGSAYVFVRDGTGMWHEEQKLIASNGAAFDFFGSSVSISEGTAVIGAPNDDDNGDDSGSAYIFEASVFQAVQSLGDINADGSEDIAVLVRDAAAGTVTATVKDAEDDHLIQQISFNPNRIPVAFEVMPDIDGNGAPELVVLGEGSVDVEIRDSLSGVLQNTVSFSSSRTPIDLAVLADQNGNGIPELAVLGRSSLVGAVSVVVKDAMTKQLLNDVGFSSNFTPIELAVIADLNGNAKVEFAVLGVDATTAGHDKVQIRDSGTDAVLNNVFYSPTIQAKRLAILADQNNNVAEELVVLREGRYDLAQINDALNDTFLNYVGYNPSFKYSQVLVIPDLNGNGVPEIGVLGTDPTVNQTRVQINDAKTAAKISVVFFDYDFKPQGDVALVNDINGNGSAELVYLGKRESDGKLRVIIRDSLTKALINTVDFTTTPPPTFAIGDTGPAGGIVFYVTDGGLHGLEAAPADSAVSPWGCYGTDIAGANGTAIGTGAQNTAAIVAGCVSAEVTAAEVANSYSLNGFTDWFLPSKDELNELRLHRAVVGGLAFNLYWSSSEYSVFASSFSAWGQSFGNGVQGEDAKDESNGVRPVRAF